MTDDELARWKGWQRARRVAGRCPCFPCWTKGRDARAGLLGVLQRRVLVLEAWEGLSDSGRIVALVCADGQGCVCVLEALLGAGELFREDATLPDYSDMPRLEPLSKAERERLTQGSWKDESR